LWSERSKVKITVKFLLSCENQFLLISSAKVDRSGFTTNQDKNDHLPIVQISLNTVHRRKCFVCGICL